MRPAPPHRPGGGHQLRKEAADLRRGEHDRLVAGDIRLGGQHNPWIGAREMRGSHSIAKPVTPRFATASTPAR